MFIETDSDTHWVAARQIAVQVGDVVQASEGMPMTDFESKSLNRTFDVVYFAGALQNLSAPALPDGHPEQGLRRRLQFPGDDGGRRYHD